MYAHRAIVITRVRILLFFLCPKLWDDCQSGLVALILAHAAPSSDFLAPWAFWSANPYLSTIMAGEALRSPTQCLIFHRFRVVLFLSFFFAFSFSSSFSFSSTFYFSFFSSFCCQNLQFSVPFPILGLSISGSLLDPQFITQSNNRPLHKIQSTSALIYSFY